MRLTHIQARTEHTQMHTDTDAGTHTHSWPEFFELRAFLQVWSGMLNRDREIERKSRRGRIGVWAGTK